MSFIYAKRVMKKTAIILTIAASALMAPGCKDKKEERADTKNVISAGDVPAPVNAAFTAKYPAATEVIWEDAHEMDEKSYKVKFKKGDVYWKAEFSADGTLIKEKADE